MSTPSRRRLAWGAALVLALALLAVGSLDTDDPTPAERARRLERTIRCPECRGQSVAQSDAPSAKGVKTVVRDLIDAGRSDEEIRDHIVASYGKELLLEPEGSGFSTLVWAIPVVVVMVAVAGLALRFRDWRPGGQHADEADRDLVAAALGATRDRETARRTDAGDDA